MIVRSIITLILLAVFLFAFEYQYMWYPNEQESRLLRAVEIISVLVAVFLFPRGRYVPIYAVFLILFCFPLLFVDTAFNWALFSILLVALAAHGGAIWLVKHLKA